MVWSSAYQVSRCLSVIPSLWSFFKQGRRPGRMSVESSRVRVRGRGAGRPHKNGGGTTMEEQYQPPLYCSTHTHTHTYTPTPSLPPTIKEPRATTMLQLARAPPPEAPFCSDKITKHHPLSHRPAAFARPALFGQAASPFALSGFQDNLFHPRVAMSLPLI